MKKYILSFILSCILPLFAIPTNKAITYGFSGGRLGDNLLAYAHAKWIQSQYQIPLVYQPFPFSDQLKLHLLEKNRINSHIKKYFVIKKAQSLNQIIYKFSNKKILWVIPYFPECRHEQSTSFQDQFRFEIDWNDSAFITELRKNISPAKPLSLVQLDTQKFNIALHVRRGCDVDFPLSHEDSTSVSDIHSDKLFPLKFPPLKYYIDALNSILRTNPEKEPYIFLFTDSKDPKSLANQIEKELKHLNIFIHYHDEIDTKTQGVLEDFFSLMNFDCIIRPTSNFSLLASHLGKNTIDVSPTEFYWVANKLFITEYLVHHKNL